MAVGRRHGAPQDRPHLLDQLAVALLEVLDERRRAFDVGHQHRDETGWELDPFDGGARASKLALGAQLAVDEPDGNDPVLLRRVQQPLAGPLAGLLVLEVDLVEAGERVADVRLVVDREAPAAGRIDQRERAVRQLRPLGGIESRHALDDNNAFGYVSLTIPIRTASSTAWVRSRAFSFS